MGMRLRNLPPAKEQQVHVPSLEHLRGLRVRDAVQAGVECRLGLGGGGLRQGPGRPRQQVPLLGRLPAPGQDLLHDLPHSPHRYEGLVEQHEDLRGRALLLLPGYLFQMDLVNQF